jgi:hypothetical protein
MNVCKIVLLGFVHHLNQWRVLHGPRAALIGLSCGFQTNSIVVYYYSSLYDYVTCVEDRFSAPKNEGFIFGSVFLVRITDLSYKITVFRKQYSASFFV